MGACFSKALVVGEKISLCFSCTGLVCCILLTILTILGLGIGLGYNHCFIDMKTRSRYVPAHYKYQDSPRWPGAHAHQWLRNMIENEDRSQITDEDNNMAGEITAPAEELINYSPVTSSNKPVGRLNSDSLENPDIMLNVSSVNISSHNKSDDMFKKSEEKMQEGTNKRIIPMTDLNLIDLLSKLKQSNHSYSIQIIRH